jgi:hypothetical protein
VRTALIAALLILCVAPTALARDGVGARVEHWKAQLPIEVPVGAPESKLVSWLASKGLEFGRDPQSRSISFVPERLKGDGLVCKSWMILATANLDTSGNVAGYKVSHAGKCL